MASRTEPDERSSGDRPQLLTVPTELERQDAFLDLGVLGASLLVVWYLALRDLAAWAIPGLILVAIWSLTGEPAADVPFIGAVASGLRSRFGLRRAHEWALAWWRYSARPQRGLMLRLIRLIPMTIPHSRWHPRRSLLPVRRWLHRPRGRRRIAIGLLAALELCPTTSYSLASQRERADAMDSLSRVLMGLSHPVQLIASARGVDVSPPWPNPPQLERRWMAIVGANDATTLAWRVRTLRTALENVGLRVSEVPVPICPKPLRVQSSAVQCDGLWSASLVLRRWPREVAPGWLGHALAGDLPVDLALHIEPQDAQRIARFLRRQQAWQSDTGSDRPDAGNELGRTDAERVRLKLIARTDRPCRVAVVLRVRAESREQLHQRVQTLGHEIGLALGDVRLAKYEQVRGLEATQATGRCDMLGAWRTLDCTSVASTWPFQPATVLHTDGAPIGTTHEGSMLVKLDPFDPSLESFGGIVVSKVGAGKSYFLKLLARRLEGVEVLVIEQRTPAEYDNVPGARSFNLADVPFDDRAEVLRQHVEGIWELAKRDPRPRLLIIDELWSLLRDPALARLVEEIARIGRHHYLALWIATQQTRELLEAGRAVLDNAAFRVLLRQHDRDLNDLCDAIGLPDPARRFLRSAARGQALLDINGLLVPVDIQATLFERGQITTDPRERVNGRLLVNA